MRFVIYKNSVLATFCSIFGAAFIVMAVTSMVSGELGILPASASLLPVWALCGWATS